MTYCAVGRFYGSYYSISDNKIIAFSLAVGTTSYKFFA